MFKKTMLLIVGLVFLLKSSSACNSCSQVSVSNNSGILIQNMFRDYISLQGRRVTFYNTTESNYASKDILTSAELTLKKSLGTKLYAWTTIPMVRNMRTLYNERLLENGIGDVRFGLDYQFKKLLGTDLFRIIPTVTMGVKVPTGHYEHYLPSQGMPRSFNAGTGAWATMFNTSVRFQKSKAGGLLSGTYFLQGKNRYTYQYGQQFNLTASVYYQLFREDKVQLFPLVGVSLDKVATDEFKGEKDAFTGGRSVMVQSGLTALLNNHALTAQVQLPLTASYAANTTELQSIITFQYTYMFTK